MQLKLFGHPESGHAYKVKLFMECNDIVHDYEMVDIFQRRESRQAEFRDNARFGEVPLLLDGNTPIVQSNAILLHLATRYSSGGTQEAATLGLCLEWLFWEANKIGMCLPQLRSMQRFGDHGINQGTRSWLLARYKHDVGIIESTLSDGRAWIVGSNIPSIADFSLCGYLYFADEAKVEVPTKVQAWLDRLAGQPAWQHPYDLLA